MRHEGVHDLFSRVAKDHAGDVAMERSGEAVTYGELESGSNRVGQALLGRGAGKGKRVGILASSPVQVTKSLLGVLKAGGVFVPLDPSFPKKRLDAMMEQSAPEAYVLEGRYARWVEGRPGAGSVLKLEELDRESSERPEVERSGSEACSIYFTSGSSGRPKAIVGRLSAIDHFVKWEIEALGLGAGTRVSQLASPSFDGYLKDVFVPLCAGGVVCAPATRDILKDARRLADWVDVEGVEVLHVVPSVLRGLLNEPLDAKYFGALRWVVLAGEALLPADVKRWHGIFGERVKLVNLYGPTETAVTKLFYFVKPEDAERPSIPIGKAMPDATVWVIRKQSQCRPGTVGEIYIRTPHVALGYYGDPKQTAEVFVANPFLDDPNDIVYRTGDYGRFLNDGNVEYLGRRDEQVKVRGVRVELREVESVLREHAGVRDVSVVDRTDAEGVTSLYAYVVVTPGTTMGELREHASQALTEAMVPSAFVTLDALPRTLNGKVDRKALPALQDVRGSGKRGRGAQTMEEELLAGIWSEVLRLPEVGATENFFELGGHSLLATQVLARVRETMKVELPLRALFEAPTVEALARLMKGATGAKEGKIEKREGPRRLSYSQKRMWVLSQLAEGRSAYHLPLGLRMKGALNVARLEQAFGEVVRRHETLRTRFESRDGEAELVVDASRPWRLPVVDLSGLDEGSREAEMRRRADEDAQRSFDLERGPLVRTVLLRLGPEHHVAVCTMHHMVTDAWSFRVLTEEMNASYESYGRGEASSLGPMTIQYSDWASWQLEELSGERLESSLGYWKERLDGAPVQLSLPQRKKRPAVQTYRGRSHAVSLERGLVEELRKVGRREGTTLYMTLMAGWLALLSQYTGQEDLVLGSVIANRDRAEVERLIGFMANTMVLRVDLAGEPSFRELLGRVREACIGAYTNQVPPEMLVQALASQRAGSTTALYEAWFQLETATDDKLSLGTVAVERYEVSVPDVPFELSLVLVDGPEGVRGQLQFDAELFDEDTIARMTAHLVSLLEQFATDPELTLRSVKLTSASDHGIYAELAEAFGA